MTEIIAVRFRSGGKEYYFDPKGLRVKAGDEVIIETAKGAEFGLCCRGNSLVEDSQIVPPLRPLLRLATDKDRATLRKNQEREKEALRVCEEKVAEYKLDMTLVRCECSFDGNKLLIFFTSEGRVDFRALVRDLSSTLHARIELRQIGVRDESKLIGGLGICGRPYCCNAFLEQFHPVSIKMAKTQGLSLNPAKISGACGRLMCCLKYEQDAYEDAVKRLPKNDSFVETPDGAGTVCEVDVLRERVKVRLESAPESPQTYAADELNVIRNGKGPRPEGYVAPPPAELEKLRRSTPKLLPVEKPSLDRDIDAVLGRSEPKSSRQPERRRSDKPSEGKKPAARRSTEAKAKSADRPNPGKEKPQEGAGGHRRHHHRGGGRGKSGGAKAEQ